MKTYIGETKGGKKVFLTDPAARAPWEAKNGTATWSVRETPDAPAPRAQKSKKETDDEVRV